MSVNGIGTVGYPVAGYETRRAQRNTAGSGFAGQMGNVRNTQSNGITLYISNPEDGEAIGSMVRTDRGKEAADGEMQEEQGRPFG